MITKKIESILNEQIGKEAYSSNLYLSMATWAEVNGLAGVATWMYAQADEERMHMLKFVKYINERGGHAVIPEIKQPPVKYDSVLDLFKKTFDHEQFISESINNIVGMAMEERDFTTNNWIQWFVNEQIEEEAQVTAILDKLKLIGDGNLYHFDNDIVSMRTGSAGSQTA